ncbi:MAG: flavodoxin family protein [Firmicutes bacterium]|nr:flavodoxin family protein [Bacillota bacterium]
MKKIVAINASPRRTANTAELVKQAAKAVSDGGGEVKYFDLYALEKFTGCISCFACKLPTHKGKCVCKDGLAQVLEEIRTSDGLILGTPNYFGDVTAGFRAFYERLVFQYLTYQKENVCCNDRKIPVLFIMTSNMPTEMYAQTDYAKMIEKYKYTLDNFVGETEVMIYGDTLQVKDYSRFNWTMFDPQMKADRHEKEFPKAKEEAYDLGKKLLERG